MERNSVTNTEIVAAIRAAAASLVNAAGAAESGDLAASEISIEDALFRTQSLLARIREAQLSGTPASGLPPEAGGDAQN